MNSNTEALLTPTQRLFRLLSSERRDIGYLYVYAIVAGLIALSLPLGVQAIIGLISGGLVFSSVYVLIGLVLAGTLVVGLLQIAQISLVEVLQRRVFAKAALELAYRIPHLRAEALQGSYPPELMNRFFDVLTIQKALPKLLIDVTTAVIQILFGVLLLSVYHVSFVVFGLALVGLLALIIRIAGPKGLGTSLAESKYKYKVAHWLEDVARALTAFKTAGHSPLAVERADHLVGGYLDYRQKHFRVLLALYGNAVAFKTLVTGGLLGLGTILVVERAISLGQFVAAELVIVLVVASVEKIINSADTVFDLLTAVEKIGYVTDLPLESRQGLDVDLTHVATPLRVELRQVRYHYPNARQPALEGLSLLVAPGERVALTGAGEAGCHTLLRVLAGLLADYEGTVQLDGFSLRDLNLVGLRSAVGYADGAEAFFAGTLLENLTMGQPAAPAQRVQQTLEALGLSDTVSDLPQGLHTPLLADGAPLATGVRARMLLARAALSHPRLLLVGSWVDALAADERQDVLRFLTAPDRPWTLLLVTHHPEVLIACDRVLTLDRGQLVRDEAVSARAEKQINS